MSELASGVVAVSTPLTSSVLTVAETVLDGTNDVVGGKAPTNHARALHLIATSDRQVSVSIRRFSAGGIMQQTSTPVVIAAGATGVQVLRDVNGDWIGDYAQVVVANASGLDATVSFQLIARS